MNDTVHSEQILKTKYFIAPFRKEFLSRPALVERINAGVKHRLVLIIAPAGYGKSTLMAEWIKQTKLPTAWLSLERTDVDPVTFLHYLIVSFQTCFPNIGHGILQTLIAPNPPSPLTLLQSLINEISTLPQDIVLLLDDFHTLANKDVLDLLSMLVFNQPQQLHIIIASRAELPFSLSRIRAWGDVLQLGIEELRFSPHEISRYLHQHLGEAISASDAQLLGDRTEGWIAALQMAVLSFQPSRDIHREASAFSGRDKFITDYLMDEVLSRQSPAIVQFLLNTSILDKLCAPLCGTIIEETGGVSNEISAQDTLEYLDRSGLFLIPLDHDRTWYRYHHLFAELLLHRFRLQQKEQEAAVHRKAAQWFFDHQMIEDAVEHWLSAGEYRIVTEYLQGIIDEEILAKGKFATFLNWLERIPEKILLDYPKLILYRVFQLWEMQHLDEFREQLKLVEKLLGPLPSDLAGLVRQDPNAASYHGILSVIKGVVNCGDYNTRLASECFRQALVLLPEEFTFWRVLSLGATGFCRRVDGDYDEANRYFAEVVELATRSNLVLLCFMYSIAQVMVFLATGQLEQAIQCCRIPIGLDARQGQTIPFAGLAYQMMGRLLYLSGDLKAAEKHTRRGNELVRRDGDVYSIANGYFNLACILLDSNQGDAREAFSNQVLGLMDEMMAVIRELNPPQSALVIARAYQAHVWIVCNRLALAQQWAVSPGISSLDASQFPDVLGRSYFGVYCTIHDPFRNYIDFIQMTLARYELASVAPHKAVNILNLLLSGRIEKNRVFFKTQVLVLKALAWLQAGEQDSAVSALWEALYLIAPQPFYQLFLSEGQSIADLLYKIQVAHPDPDNAEVKNFIHQILLRSPFTPLALSQTLSPTAGDLTTRELDVLKDLAGGVSYDETAQNLGISVNTVKTHIKRIYSKLNVANRLQAVNKAKELGLLNNLSLEMANPTRQMR